MVLANKYRFYIEKVREKKLGKQTNINESSKNIDKVLYLTKEFHDKTPEGEVMDELGLNKMCCRRHLLTHVDIE
jgi:DNA-directed RNA polymerase I, II, and III subunit RPABC5